MDKNYYYNSYLSCHFGLPFRVLQFLKMDLYDSTYFKTLFAISIGNNLQEIGKIILRNNYDLFGEF